jgi:hypothetical protein
MTSLNYQLHKPALMFQTIQRSLTLVLLLAALAGVATIQMHAMNALAKSDSNSKKQKDSQKTDSNSNSKKHNENKAKVGSQSQDNKHKDTKAKTDGALKSNSNSKPDTKAKEKTESDSKAKADDTTDTASSDTKKDATSNTDKKPDTKAEISTSSTDKKPDTNTADPIASTSTTDRSSNGQGSLTNEKATDQPDRVGIHDNAQQTSGEGANKGGTVTDPTLCDNTDNSDCKTTVKADCFGKVIQHRAQEHKDNPDEGTLGSHTRDPVPELPGNETPRQGIGNQDQGHPAAHGAFNSQFDEDDEQNVVENC